MIFENFIAAITIFSIFPFDNLLDTQSLIITEELAKDLRSFYIKYLVTSLFLTDLENNNLLYVKKPGYYENLLEKFLASSEILALPKICKDSSVITYDLRMQFIKYIQFQQFTIGHTFFLPCINSMFAFFAIFSYIDGYLIPGLTNLTFVNVLIHSKALAIISYHAQNSHFIFMEFTSEEFMQICKAQIPQLIKNLGVLGIFLHKLPVGGFLKNFAGQALITAST